MCIARIWKRFSRCCPLCRHRLSRICPIRIGSPSTQSLTKAWSEQLSRSLSSQEPKASLNIQSARSLTDQSESRILSQPERSDASLDDGSDRFSLLAVILRLILSARWNRGTKRRLPFIFSTLLFSTLPGVVPDRQRSCRRDRHQMPADIPHSKRSKSFPRG